MTPARSLAVVASALGLMISTSAAAIGNAPPGGLPSANEYSAQILPERAGIVSWRKDVLALDRKETRVQGFMIPLDVGDRQKRFLLTAVPTHCSFCLPAGPDALVEVVAKTPVKYTFEPIVVAGRFSVLKDDSTGLLYRLSDATQVEVVQVAPTAPPNLVPRTPKPPETR